METLVVYQHSHEIARFGLNERSFIKETTKRPIEEDIQSSSGTMHKWNHKQTCNMYIHASQTSTHSHTLVWADTQWDTYRDIVKKGMIFQMPKEINHLFG